MRTMLASTSAPTSAPTATEGSHTTDSGGKFVVEIYEDFQEVIESLNEDLGEYEGIPLGNVLISILLSAVLCACINLRLCCSCCEGTKKSKAKDSGNNEKKNGESDNVVSQGTPPSTLETELPNRKVFAGSISMAEGTHNDLCTNPLFQDLKKQESTLSGMDEEGPARDWSRQQSW